jgi:hypothetical protein
MKQACCSLCLLPSKPWLRLDLSDSEPHPLIMHKQAGLKTRPTLVIGRAWVQAARLPFARGQSRLH